MDKKDNVFTKTTTKINQAFTNKLFNGYYPKELRYRQEAYDYVRSLYGNKMICLAIASLLEMDLTPSGTGLIVSSEYGKVNLTFDFTPQNMDIKALQKDFDALNELIPILMKAGKEKSPDKYVKNASDFTEFTSEFFLSLAEVYYSEDEYAKKQYFYLFSNANAEMFNTRKKDFNLDRDIVLAATASFLYTIRHNHHRDLPGETNLTKLKKCCEKKLRDEIKYSYANRIMALRALGDCQEKHNQHFWAYISQAQRIRECPEMW